MRWPLALVPVLLLGCRPATTSTAEPSPASPASPSSSSSPDDPSAAGAPEQRASSESDASPEPATHAALEDDGPPAVDAGITPPEHPLKPPGPLDKNTIRTEIRANIHHVRACYNQGLAKDPNLQGRVEVQFTIGPKGTVVVSLVASTTLPEEHASVGECVAAAVKFCTFPPPPGGGNAVVTYPFVLMTDEPVLQQWTAASFSPGTVSILVTDVDDNPVAGQEVTLTIEIKGRKKQRRKQTDEHGRATFIKVPHGAKIRAATDSMRSDFTDFKGSSVETLLLQK